MSWTSTLSNLKRATRFTVRRRRGKQRTIERSSLFRMPFAPRGRRRAPRGWRDGILVHGGRGLYAALLGTPLLFIDGGIFGYLLSLVCVLLAIDAGATNMPKGARIVSVLLCLTFPVLFFVT